jgi:hypothetical protein
MGLSLMNRLFLWQVYVPHIYHSSAYHIWARAAKKTLFLCCSLELLPAFFSEVVTH